MDRTHKKNLFLLILIIILLLLILFFSLRAYHHYDSWKSYKDYFQHPDPKIDSWMSIKLISEKFSIDESTLFRELNISKKDINTHMTLNQFCKTYSQNCTELVNRLNELNRK